MGPPKEVNDLDERVQRLMRLAYWKGASDAGFWVSLGFGVLCLGAAVCIWLFL